MIWWSESFISLGPSSTPLSHNIMPLLPRLALSSPSESYSLSIFTLFSFIITRGVVIHAVEGPPHIHNLSPFLQVPLLARSLHTFCLPVYPPNHSLTYTNTSSLTSTAPAILSTSTLPHSSIFNLPITSYLIALFFFSILTGHSRHTHRPDSPSQ